MIRDMLKVYNELLELDPDLMEVSNKLKPGFYIRFDVDKTMAENLADLENNSFVVDNKFYENGLDFDNKLHEWMLERDKLSKYITVSKGLSWQIHTTNMFSFSIKEKSFYTKKGVDIGFGILKTLLLGYYARIGELPDKYVKLFGVGEKKLSNNELIERFKADDPRLSEYVYSDERSEMFGKIYELMVSGSDELETFLRDNYGDLGNEDYIKVYFDVPVENYEHEKKMYKTTYMFGSSDTIQLNNYGMTSGVPLNDYVVNKQKKPYLRCRAYNIAYSELNDVAFESSRQELFNWLNGGLFNSGNVLSLSMSEEFNTLSMINQRILIDIKLVSKEKHIVNYDDLSFDRPDEVSIEIKSYLGDGYVIEKERTIEGIIKRMMKTFFNERVSGDFIRKISEKTLGTDNIMIKGEMNNYFIGIRNDLSNWYHTGNEKGIASKFDQFSLGVIRSFITYCLGLIDGKNENYTRDTEKHLIEMLNLRWSLLSYFDVGYTKGIGDEILEILNWFMELRETKSEEVVLDSEAKFYFVSGQLFKYLNEQSKSAKGGMHYLKKAMSCNSVEAVKVELVRLLGLYGHSIFENYRFFNRSVASVMAYEGSTKSSKVARDMITVGMFADNVFLAKLAKDESDDGNGSDEGTDSEDELKDEKGEM